MEKVETTITKVPFAIDPHANVREELTTDEIKCLDEVKQNKIATDFPERFIAICLVCRKWDVKRTLQLLENNKKMRKTHNYESWDSLPTFDKLDPKLTIDFGFWKQPGLKSKEGHPIHFLEPAKLIPKNHKFENIVDYAMWAWHIVGQGASIEEHKKGFIIIEDLKGMSFANIDFNLSKNLMASVQDKIPQRMEKIIIINPPSFISALFSFAKLFLSKKMLERFEVLKKKEDLEKYVEVNQLPIQFGGKSKYTHEDYKSDIKEWADQYNF